MPLSVLMVCLFGTDGVHLCDKRPSPHCIPSSVLHIVHTECALWNALTGSQIKRAALDRTRTTISKNKTFPVRMVLDRLNLTYLVLK